MKTKKNFAFDFLYNVIAYAIPVFANQIIIQPTLGKMLSEDVYGSILTLINLINLIPFTVGNTLNNLRLIRNQEYLDKRVNGDFGILLSIGCFFALFLSTIGFKYFKNSVSSNELLFFIILSAVWFFREYYIVVFRLAIDYKNILFNNLIMGIGYLVGLFFFSIGFFGGYWELIYILGQLMSLSFIFWKGNKIFREKLVKTELFSKTLNMAILLLCANFLSSGLSNLDKLFIQPLLGNTAVSIYHASSVFTKIISTCTAPMAMVLLSYLSKKRTLERRTLILTFQLSFFVAICGYLFCVSFGRIFIQLLYPKYYYDAVLYIWITSANTMIALIISMIRPFTMKFCDIKWQIVVGILSNVGYFVGILLLIRKYNI